MNKLFAVRAAAVFALFFALVLAWPSAARAFWLLGFSPADTLAPGSVSLISGTGAQFTQVGNAPRDSFTAFLPHAGFRVGLADGLDIGYRLTQVALPFSSVGPSLGGELDAKWRLTPAASLWQAALVGGFAYSGLEIENSARSAWSPGVDLVLSRKVANLDAIFTEFRYIYTAIPTAFGGAADNYLNAVGLGEGFKIGLTSSTSVIPELGLYRLDGEMARADASGWALQVGAVVSQRW